MSSNSRQGQTWGVGGSRPPEFGQGGRGGSQGGSRNIIIAYYVQEVCFKVVTFEEKYNNLPRSAFNGTRTKCPWTKCPRKNVLDKMSQDKKSPDKMSQDKMSMDKKSLDKKSPDKMF